MDADKLAALMEANGACGHDLPGAALRAAIAAIRRDSLEEAAKACEARAGSVSMFATPRDARDHNATVRGCAVAIRALIEPASPPER